MSSDTNSIDDGASRDQSSKTAVMNLIGTCPVEGTVAVLKRSSLSEDSAPRYVCSECEASLSGQPAVAENFRQHVVEDLD